MLELPAWGCSLSVDAVIIAPSPCGRFQQSQTGPGEFARDACAFDQAVHRS